MKRQSILFLIFFFIFLSCSRNEKIQEDLEMTISWEKNIQIEMKEKEELFQTEKDIFLEKENRLFSRLIKKWDYYIKNNEIELALRSYLVAYKKLGSTSRKLEKKIANAYWELGKFKEAAIYYKLSDELTEQEQRRHAYSVYYSFGDDLLDILDKYNWLGQEGFYLSFLYNCQKDYTQCLDTIVHFPEPHEEIDRLKEVIDNFYASEDTDENYRDALIIWEFFREQNYPTVVVLGEKILEKRPDYIAVLSMVAQSYFELWFLEESREKLSLLLKIQPNDLTTSYLLGRVYFELWDYVTSNIYFNKVVKGEYDGKIDVERYLAYNYYLLDADDNLFQVLSYLLENEFVQPSDFFNAIYLAIEKEKMDLAKKWSQQAYEKYQDFSMAHALYGIIIEKEEGFNAASGYFKQAIRIDIKNPIALLALGIWNFEKKKYALAKGFFLKTIQTDSGGIYGKRAEEYLEFIRNMSYE